MEPGDCVLEKQVEAIEEYKQTIPFEEIRVVHTVVENLTSMVFHFKDKDFLQFIECLKSIDGWLADNEENA